MGNITKVLLLLTASRSANLLQKLRFPAEQGSVCTLTVFLVGHGENHPLDCLQLCKHSFDIPFGLTYGGLDTGAQPRYFSFCGQGSQPLLGQIQSLLLRLKFSGIAHQKHEPSWARGSAFRSGCCSVGITSARDGTQYLPRLWNKGGALSVAE